MATQFTARQTMKLLDFVGYGNLRAPIWFLGTEERGNHPERLRQRLKFSPVMDLKEAHEILGIPEHHNPPYKLQPTWATMCRIVFTLKGADTERKALQDYQANHLGCAGGQTMLTELMPLPASDMKHWPYRSLMPCFPDRKTYKCRVRPARINLLRGLIAKYRPSIVVCYGKGAWQHYQDIFEGTDWHKRDGFLVGQWKKTHVFLTPHFARGNMSKARVKQLCRLIRETGFDADLI